MRVEVFSDVVCPWCYIGKRRLETALRRFEHADEVEVTWRSFQLDPTARRGSGRPLLDALAEKFGGADGVRQMTARVSALAEAEGLHYDFAHAVAANTFDAHRLAHLAADTRDLGEAAHERLLRAHLVDGEDVGDADTLARIGAEIGVPEDETRQALAGDAYAAEVEADIRAATQFGVTGVPFFVLDRRYGVSGAQSVETLVNALGTARQDAVDTGGTATTG